MIDGCVDDGQASGWVAGWLGDVTMSACMYCMCGRINGWVDGNFLVRPLTKQ